MYLESTDSIRERMLTEVVDKHPRQSSSSSSSASSEPRHWLFTNELDSGGRAVRTQDHLCCFVGGLFALGASFADRVTSVHGGNVAVSIVAPEHTQRQGKDQGQGGQGMVLATPSETERQAVAQLQQRAKDHLDIGTCTHFTTIKRVSSFVNFISCLFQGGG